MILTVDVGNTNVTLGVFAGRRLNEEPTEAFRLKTDRGLTEDDWGLRLLGLFAAAQIEPRFKKIIVASVVPKLDRPLSLACRRYLQKSPLFVGPDIAVPLDNLTDRPEEVGADRLVNAFAAWQKKQSRWIVVDFGTATTFDCISDEGEYLGGIITPGPELSALSLSHFTAKLPKVDVAEPQNLIGKNTIDSLKSGLYFGYIALVDGIIDRLIDEMGEHTRILATGGLAHVMSPRSRWIKPNIIDSHLTLKGLRQLA